MKFKVPVQRCSNASLRWAIASVLTACGGGGGEYDAFAITCATGGATNSAILTWDPVLDPALAGYRIYYGTAHGAFFQIVDVNNVTTYTVTGLSSGTTYYFATTAYDSSSPPNGSGFSNVVCKTMP